MRELKGERTIVCDTCVRVWMNGESRDGRSVANGQKECKLTWQVSQYVFQTFFAMKSGSLHSLHTMGSEGGGWSRRALQREGGSKCQAGNKDAHNRRV